QPGIEGAHVRLPSVAIDMRASRAASPTGLHRLAYARHGCRVRAQRLRTADRLDAGSRAGGRRAKDESAPGLAGRAALRAVEAAALERRRLARLVRPATFVRFA